MSSNVKVVCRFRPQLANELAKNGTNIVHVNDEFTSAAVDGQRKAQFTFDRIFTDASTQEDVYEYAAKPIVEDVLKGYNGTIFAYGQTSSGKTHTMEGPSIDNPSERGIIPRIVYNVFQYIDMAPETLEFTVRVTYFEIYMEKIYDLLCDGNNNLQIHENRERGVYVRHATELYMQDPEDVMDVMRAGAERRSVAATNMNDVSSRSHSVFLMEITQKDTIKGGVKTGKLFLVDLAGSEKVSKTGAEGEVLSEAKNINKSLSALGLVIMSLVEKGQRTHIPYRDSKLTRILQESLGGNSRTTIIICCSPSSYNEQETISTLRFGQRAKSIKNKAKINIKYSAEELQKQLDKAKKELQRLAKKLKQAEAELEIWRSGGSVSESDRVQLGQAKVKLDDDDDEGEEGTEEGKPTVPGISEEERKELLAREEELLDLLDDKDKFIHELEREIETLSEDRVTITKLVSEKAQLQQMLDEQEEVEQQLTAENEDFEVALQDLAEVNEKLDSDLCETKEYLEKSENALRDQTNQFAQKLTTVCEALSLLGSKDTVNAALPESNTVADTQLSKVQAFFKQITSGSAALQKEQTEFKTKQTELVSDLDDTKKKLKTTELSVQQLEQKTKDLIATKERLSQENETLRHQYNESRDKLEKLMTETLASQAEDMKAELEKERTNQREYFLSENAQLQTERDQANEQLAEAREEKAKLEIEVEQLKSDLDSERKRAEDVAGALQQIQAKEADAEEKEQQAEVIEVAAKQQLHTYNAFSDKLRSSILEMCKKQLNPLSGDGSDNIKENSVEDSKTRLLNEIEILRHENKDISSELKKANRRVNTLSGQLDRSRQEMKHLEGEMRKAASEYQKQVRSHIQQRQARGQGNQFRRAQAIRGHGPINGHQDAHQEFWKEEQAQQRRNIVHQGEPMVGQFAEDRILAEKELNTVQYV
eukprot:m.14228 g.14228  ORF g.14228 m.14228 type:complete len:937 (-) comp4276_c0_seq1:155-2965(-)